jgi:hypothetical protein
MGSEVDAVGRWGGSPLLNRGIAAPGPKPSVRLAHVSPPLVDSRICRRCLAIALFRSMDISQRSGRAALQLGCNSRERTTLVSLPMQLNSHVSSNPVARRDSGGENS